MLADVRFGSKADIPRCPTHVRFYLRKRTFLLSGRHFINQKILRGVYSMADKSGVYSMADNMRTQRQSDSTLLAG
jgi:hypothetical protein